jgi:hypothetical protein
VYWIGCFSRSRRVWTEGYALFNRPRRWANSFGLKPVFTTAIKTRSRVSGRTFSGELRVRDTVAIDKEAHRATSRIVGDG